MPWTDLPPEQLRTFRSDAVAAPDLAQFWADRLEQARSASAAPTLTPVRSRLTRLDVQDLEFSGAQGHRIRGWLLRPSGVTDELPCVVQFIGYGGGRGPHEEWTLWPSAGWATLVMDTRGQRWSHTPDPGWAGNPQEPGFVTSGITDPQTHYYARVFVDGARAVEVARELPGVDPSRVAVVGASQGGAISIAAAALAGGVLGAVVGVPFWCDVLRAATLVDSAPYNELARYLAARPDEVETVTRTLSYLDCALLAPLATVPALFSVAFMDDVCPPSTVYAAYNAWAGPKQIREYPFSGHEGGDIHHTVVELDFLAALAGG